MSQKPQLSTDKVILLVTSMQNKLTAYNTWRHTWPKDKIKEMTFSFSIILFIFSFATLFKDVYIQVSYHHFWPYGLEKKGARELGWASCVIC